MDTKLIAAFVAAAAAVFVGLISLVTLLDEVKPICRAKVARGCWSKSGASND
jgi:hypothetical protein